MFTLISSRRGRKPTFTVLIITALCLSFVSVSPSAARAATGAAPSVPRLSGTITWNYTFQEDIPADSCGDHLHETRTTSGHMNVSLVQQVVHGVYDPNSNSYVDATTWVDDNTSTISATENSSSSLRKYACGLPANASSCETATSATLSSVNLSAYRDQLMAQGVEILPGFPASTSLNPGPGLYPWNQNSKQANLIIIPDSVPVGANATETANGSGPIPGQCVFGAPYEVEIMPNFGGFGGQVTDPSYTAPSIDFAADWTHNRTDPYGVPGIAGALTQTEHLQVSGVLSAAMNHAPVVDAGPAVSGHSHELITLAGNVTDDGLPSPPGATTINWSMADGPTGGVVTFTNPTSANTQATFSKPGHYVLRLSASDSELTSSATTTADIKDIYTIRTRSWIPQPQVVDPFQPVSLPYRAWVNIHSPAESCWTPVEDTTPHISVTSTFDGDGHAAFDGGYRVQDVITFDWDGQTVTNVQTSPEPHVGLTVRNRTFTDKRTATELTVCRTTARAADTTSVTTPGSNTINISYTGTNPLTAQGVTPSFKNEVVAAVKPDGSVSLSYQTTQFPSSGLQVQINGSPILTGQENDVSCLSNSDVLGPRGAIRLATGLNTTWSGTATAVPDTFSTFAHASSLC